MMFSDKCVGELLDRMSENFKTLSVIAMIPDCWDMVVITVCDFMPAVIHPFVPFQRNFLHRFCFVGYGLADFYMVC